MQHTWQSDKVCNISRFHLIAIVLYCFLAQSHKHQLYFSCFMRLCQVNPLSATSMLLVLFLPWQKFLGISLKEEFNGFMWLQGMLKTPEVLKPTFQETSAGNVVFMEVDIRSKSDLEVCISYRLIRTRISYRLMRIGTRSY